YAYSVRAVDPAGNLSVAVSPVVVTLSQPLVVVPITSGVDDAEEYVNGTVSLNDTDLELVNDGSSRGNQVVGLRFPAVSVPAGARILDAYIQFEVDEIGSGATTLNIR